MPAPLKASIPLGLDMKDGYVLRFTAVDAKTGALVSGVVVSDVAVQADTVVAPIPDTTPLRFELLPGD